MSRPFSLVVFVALFVAAPVRSPVGAQTGSFDLDKTKRVLTGLIDKAIAEQGVPSISIALVKDDAIVWTAAFGHANVRTKTPATTATIYSTGSTFKAATATALMQLVEQGKIQLDHPVNRYLGDARVQDRLQVDKPVIVTHVLSHWSGLTAGAVTKPIWGRELPNSLPKMVSRLYSVRAPESRWEYNNFAYGMAGLLIEKISGMEYEDYMLEHLLKPLGVETPHPVRPSPEMVELMALPYLPGGRSGKPRPVAQVHYDVYPAGDIYLTAEDMARFLGAHLNGGQFQGHRILSEESVREMHEARFGGTYGLGFFVGKDLAGHRTISHSGGIPGQSSFMKGDLDARVGVYYMSNSGAPSSIADAAISLLRGEEYIPLAKRGTIAVDAGTLESYAGVYELAPQFTLTVTWEAGGLTARQTGSQVKRELAAIAPARFFMKGTGVLLTFVKNGAGVVDRVIFDTSGQGMPAYKRP